jgi:hypothetical protein
VEKLFIKIKVVMTDEYLLKGIERLTKKKRVMLKNVCKSDFQEIFDKLDILIENQHMLKEIEYYGFFVANICALTNLGLLQQDGNNGAYFMY